MLTTLTEQAEMFTLRVPTSSDCLRMSICKSLWKLFPFMLILMLQISNTSCATLKIEPNSSKLVNFTVFQSNLNISEDLSSITEASDQIYPRELENIPDFSHEIEGEPFSDIFLERFANFSHGIEGEPFLDLVTEKIPDFNHEIEGKPFPDIIIRLRTRLTVGNQNNNNQTGFSEMIILKPNESNIEFTDTPLSEIEYIEKDEFEKYLFSSRRLLSWKVKRNSRNENTAVSENSEVELNSSSEEDISNDSSSRNSEENQINSKFHRHKYATGRQFVFHPYLPYGKDVTPDEKISFHDILPIKVVKFIKSMVEEADWNGMFKSMVRTVVDHFVNKIIEKMFSEKDDDHDHFKKRSIDVLLAPSLVLPTFATPVFRFERSVSSSSSPDQDEDLFNFPSSKRRPQEIDVEKKKSAEERKSWLDHFLDFVFPNTKSSESDVETIERLKKRDTTNNQLFKIVVAFFLNTFEKSSGMLSDAKDVLRYKMLKEFLPYIYQKRYMNNLHSSTNSLDAMRMTHRAFTKRNRGRNDNADNTVGTLMRSKRSTGDSFQNDADRLWQAHSRRHRPHVSRARDECSLRRACNAGRLLSRLPSIQAITLQLRTNGDEPHWDALIWGMKKERCSRIFCKRHRSPKGSKYPWNFDKERFSKRVEIVTEPSDVWIETDNLTI